MAPDRPPRRRRLGLRHEVSILLTACLLLLIVLSTFTLFSYRSAVVRLREERRNEAAALARGAAEKLVARGAGGASAGLDAIPRARGMAVIGPDGATRSLWGEMPAGNLLLPAGGRMPREPLGVGPNADGATGAVAGFAPFRDSAGGLSAVRVDLPAEGLEQQGAALRILIPAVLGLNTAVLLLVLFYLRHLLTPYETLLARVREAGAAGALPAAGEGEDEVGVLLAAFDYALSELATRQVRQSEEDIATLERTLAASLESGLLLLDRDGGVLALNAVGARLLDVAIPPTGTPLAAVLAGQPALFAILRAALADGRPLKREECAVQSAGVERTLGLTAHPLRRGDGSVRGYLVLFADLTDALRRAQESRLAESLASLGLAGGVAHELRNGLATLRGYLTLIERRPEEEAVADYLGEIRRETDHLGRVVEDFLSFARPGTARRGPVALAAVALRAAADPALAGFPVTVAAEPGAGEGLAGDEQLLERAVRNLLHNAAQAERAAGREGPVEVRVAEDVGGARLTVDDRGGGVPAEVRESLFAPFSTGRAGGVGLGLALARRIVVLHGGRLSLEDREGGGTRALLFIPRDTDVTEGNRSLDEPASPKGAP